MPYGLVIAFMKLFGIYFGSALLVLAPLSFSAAATELATAVPCSISMPSTVAADDAFYITWKNAGNSGFITRDGGLNVGTTTGASGSVRTFSTNTLGTYTYTLTTTVGGVAKTCSASTTYTYTPAAVSGYDIIIVAGQSNAVGRGEGPFSDPLQGGIDNNIVQIGRNGSSTMKVVPVGYWHDGVKTDGLQFWRKLETDTGLSFSLRFARLYAANELSPGRKVLIVPAADGGTSILEWLGKAGPTALPLYSDMRARIKAALALPGENRVVAFLWQQGESDVGNMTPSAYETNLKQFFSMVRADIPAPVPFPILAGLMVPAWGSADPALMDMKHQLEQVIVNVTVLDPYDSSVSSSGLISDQEIGRPGGDIHFNAQSQVTLGGRYFTQWQNIIAAHSGTLSGVVWSDINANTKIDAGESKFSGEKVLLLNSTTGATLQTVTTDASGVYAFPNLRPGVYRVQHTVPAGYIRTTDNSTVLTLSGDKTYNFGLYKNKFTVSGYVYRDLNTTACCGGVKDTGEAGVAGRTVKLTNVDGTIIYGTTTTDAAGRYSFANLAAGSYRLTHAVPTGFVRTTDNSSVLTVNNDKTYNFGIYAP